MEEIKFLIVEDDFSQALLLKELLANQGYLTIEIVDNGQDAIQYFKKAYFDIVLMDIQLIGELDGIQTAIKIEQINSCSIIYVTSLNDKNTFDRAKKTFPEFFLSKPFNQYQLLDVIENTIESSINSSKKHPFLKDFFFIKSDKNIIYNKHNKSEVLYLEANASYTNLVLDNNKILISKNIKQCLKTIDSDNIIRINRSQAININRIESIEGVNSIKLKGVLSAFYVSDNYKEDFSKLINRL